jgi:hypothetical protein
MTYDAIFGPALNFSLLLSRFVSHFACLTVRQTCLDFQRLTTTPRDLASPAQPSSSPLSGPVQAHFVKLS